MKNLKPIWFNSAQDFTFETEILSNKFDSNAKMFVKFLFISPNLFAFLHPLAQKPLTKGINYAEKHHRKKTFLFFFHLEFNKEKENNNLS